MKPNKKTKCKVCKKSKKVIYPYAGPIPIGPICWKCFGENIKITEVKNETNRR